MADDWDLYAVVRSCTSAAANTTATASNDFKKENSSSWREESRLACLTSLTVEEEDDLLSFSSFLQLRKNGSVQDSYKPFLPYADPTTISANQGIDPTSASSVPGGSNGQHHQHQRSQQLQEHPTTSTIGISSPLTPTSATNFAFGQSGNQQQPDSEWQINPLHRQRRNMHSQAPRSAKRKNHQKRTVCQVREDNFSSDPWAWRKYGQKPIKGSPYPRNYYRCSSSKGCSARKQVERSNLEPNIFIVTYRGNHTHPRPTHRNSLAGSTRNKLSTIQKAASKDSAMETLPATAASCSSLCSATRLSPISPRTPLSALEEATDPVHHTGGNGGVSLETAPERESGEQDLLIPNVHVDEDLFKGLEELVGGSGSSGTANTNSGLRRSPAFSENFSSWRTGNSAASAGSTAGGGC